MITNGVYTLDRASISGAEGLISAVHAAAAGTPLRWFVSEATDSHLVVETTEHTGLSLPPLPDPGPAPPDGRDVVVSLVPTGVGCAIGGYAGDAAPATALLAACSDYLVTNPNAVNASDFIRLDRSVVYTEGSCVDLFCQGAVNLHLPRANRVGVIVERAEPAALRHVLSVVDAVRAVHGVDIAEPLVTDRPIGARCVRHPSGAYVGQVDHPDVLLSAARELSGRGADAIAVTTNVQGLPAEAYRRHFQGAHPNPVGGAEAVMSHLISRALHLPAAHAPMVNFKAIPAEDGVDARGAGEFVSFSGLACVLVGLHRAPQFTLRRRQRAVDTLSVHQVAAVVAPATALGAQPVLHAERLGIPVIAVRDNDTILKVDAAALGLRGVIEAASYAEAAGIVMALRRGISLGSIRRPLPSYGGNGSCRGRISASSLAPSSAAMSSSASTSPASVR